MLTRQTVSMFSSAGWSVFASSTTHAVLLAVILQVNNDVGC